MKDGFPRGRCKKYPFGVLLVLLWGVPLLLVAQAAASEDSSCPSGMLSATQNVTTRTTVLWEKVQDKLCPNLKPQRVDTLGVKIFALALEEIDASIDFRRHVQANGSVSVVNSFFHGNFGWATYMNTTSVDGSGIAYVRIWKAGNDQIRSWMEHVWLPAMRDKNASIRDYIAYFGLPPDACYITAIRDPIQHFLSGYNEIEYRLPQLIDYSVNEAMLTSANFVDHPLPSMERFRAFVHDLVLTKPIFAETSLNFTHCYPMMRVLTDMKGRHRSLTAYLPSLENLLQTWPKFVHDTCGGAAAVPPALLDQPTQSEHKHLTSSDPFGTYQAAKDQWRAGGPTMRALCLLHIYDYACWRDLPDEVPPFCLDVYTNQTILSRLFGNSFIETTS